MTSEQRQTEAFDAITEKFMSWCELHNLTPMSMDELLHEIQAVNTGIKSKIIRNDAALSLLPELNTMLSEWYKAEELTEGLNRTNLYLAPITSREGAYNFIDRLHKDDLLFHFDDDPYDCLKGTPKTKIDLIKARLDETFALDCWTKDDCPIGVALEFYNSTEG